MMIFKTLIHDDCCSDWSSPPATDPPSVTESTEVTKESTVEDERLKIMELIKEGIITPREGLDLLEALGAADKPVAEPYDDPGKEPASGPSRKKKAKWLYIQVNEEDGKNVNIKVPIGMAKLVGNFIPKQAKKEMSKQGIDLDIPELMKALEECGELDMVNVDEGDGKTVRIFVK